MKAMAFGIAGVATALWMAGLSSSRKRFRRYFLDGRSIVARLKW